jgi:hypothetical protein
MICRGFGVIRAAACGAGALIAAVIMASCSDTCTEPKPQPQPIAKTLKIAFVSNRNGNSEIYVLNADGANLTDLTHPPGDDFDPTWSPTVPRSSTHRTPPLTCSLRAH